MATGGSCLSVPAKVTRSRMLRRADGPTYEAVIEEAAIRRPAASRAVMARQLHHLVELARQGEYATPSMTAIDLSACPAPLNSSAPSPVPALLIGRLATDNKVARMGVGTAMVKHLLATAVELALAVDRPGGGTRGRPARGVDLAASAPARTTGGFLR